MAPARSLVHIPALVLPAIDRAGLGPGLLAALWLNRPHLVHVHLCTFHRHVAGHLDDSVFPHRPYLRAQRACGEPDGVPGIADSETGRGTGLVCAAGREGAD